MKEFSGPETSSVRLGDRDIAYVTYAASSRSREVVEDWAGKFLFDLRSKATKVGADIFWRDFPELKYMQIAEIDNDPNKWQMGWMWRARLATSKDLDLGFEKTPGNLSKTLDC